jgi:cytochrome c553
MTGSPDGGQGGAASGPDGGGPKPDGSSPDGTTASVPFSVVQAILAQSCVTCHDPARPFVPETTTYVAMNLTATGAYAALVNKPATQACGGTLVTPGDPTKSYLYAKVSQATPCYGERMPHRGMLAIQPMLSDKDIATIAAWITGGARP